MSPLVDWEYYSSTHGKITEEGFDHAESLAEKEVRLVVGWARWQTISEDAFYYEQLRDCICNVMDKMAEDVVSGKGKGVASVSNDGYSESYAVQTEEQLRNELQSSIRAWLSGNGLAGAY